MKKRTKRYAIFLVCVPIVLLFANSSLGQSATKYTADRFRNETVKKWQWKPRSGVALTTTNYAVEHLKDHYLSQDGQLPRPSIAFDGSRVDVREIEEGVVLFQTSTLDIIVLSDESLAYYGGSETPVLVINRNSKRVLFHQMLGGPCESTFEFVELDSNSPLELKQMRSCSTAGAGGGWSISIHALNSEFQEVVSISGSFVPSKCPGLQQKWGNIELRKPNVVEFEFEINLALARDEACRFVNPSRPTKVIRRCKWDSTTRLSRCTESIKKPRALELVSLKHFLTTENKRYLRNNRAKLRRNGFSMSVELQTALKEVEALDDPAGEKEE